MKIAVFSDIHGNPYALEAVLYSLKKNGPYDHIVAAGDVCFGGSSPEKCIRLLVDNNIQTIYGNTEKYITESHIPPSDAHHLEMWPQILIEVEWIKNRIDPGQFAWLDSLPLSLKFSPNDNPSDALLVVHAHPKSIEGFILPPAPQQIKLFGEVIQPDEDPDLLSYFSGVPEDTIAFGHFHFSNTRKWYGKTLVNVSPCSRPSFDHDLRARYTSFHWSKDQWNIKSHLILYNYDLEKQATLKARQPGWERYLEYFK